jgi:hypothetical protein
VHVEKMSDTFTSCPFGAFQCPVSIRVQRRVRHRRGLTRPGRSTERAQAQDCRLRIAAASLLFCGAALRSTAQIAESL